MKPLTLLMRHCQGDWGDLGREDRKSNDWAVDNEERIFSSYNVGDGKFWCITVGQVLDLPAFTGGVLAAEDIALSPPNSRPPSGGLIFGRVTSKP